MGFTFTATQPQPRDGLVHPKYVGNDARYSIDRTLQEVGSQGWSLELKRTMGLLNYCFLA